MASRDASMTMKDDKNVPDETGSEAVLSDVESGDGIVLQTISSKTSVSTPELPRQPLGPTSPVPDGGRQAWLVVLSSSIALVFTWGLVNSFGVFQTYYETSLLSSRSSSDISWIGSLQGALLMMGGVVSGPLFDMGYFRYLLTGGLLFVVFGMFMTSLCGAYWQVVLAQGITVGLGCALMFLPVAAIVSQYFAKRRALALGVQSAGSPIAGIVLPIIFGRLQPRIGFGWATRVIAFVLLALSVVPIAFMKTRVPPPKHKRAFLDYSAMRDLPFVVFSVGCFFAFLGIYVPFFYVQLYSLEYKISTVEFSPYFVTLMNAGSVVGRLAPNFVADHVGSVNVMMAVTFVSSVMAFAWLGIGSFGGLIVFSVLYGMFSGGIVSVAPSACVSFCPDMSRVGTRMGMNFFVAGFSVLVGTPIGGAILAQGGSQAWTGIIAYSGAMLMTGFILFALAQMLK